MFIAVMDIPSSLFYPKLIFKLPLFHNCFELTVLSIWLLQVKEVPAGETEAMVTGLEEGKPVDFRVTAVNRAGPSEPSEASPTISPKSRKGRHRGSS